MRDLLLAVLSSSYRSLCIVDRLEMRWNQYNSKRATVEVSSGRTRSNVLRTADACLLCATLQHEVSTSSIKENGLDGLAENLPGLDLLEYTVVTNARSVLLDFNA